jgi:hypothetical protein
MTTLVRFNPVRVLAAVAALALTTSASLAGDTKTPGKDNKLVGAWKLVSAKYGGKEQTIQGTHLKHVTPSHFIWVTLDKDGQIRESLGGSYTVDGDKYAESPEYGFGAIVAAFKGKTQAFTWKVEGSKWHHTGKLSTGLAIEEVWEQVEGK